MGTQMKRPGHHGASLALCITLAMAVKLLLLILLWRAFFAAPQTMHLHTSEVERHVLAPPLAPLLAPLAPASPLPAAPSLRAGER